MTTAAVTSTVSVQHQCSCNCEHGFCLQLIHRHRDEVRERQERVCVCIRLTILLMVLVLVSCWSAVADCRCFSWCTASVIRSVTLNHSVRDVTIHSALLDTRVLSLTHTHIHTHLLHSLTHSQQHRHLTTFTHVNVSQPTGWRTCQDHSWWAKYYR